MPAQLHEEQSARPRLRFAGGTVELYGLAEWRIKRIFGSGLWTRDPRSGIFRADAQHYAAIRQRFYASRLDCSDQVCQWEAVTWGALALPQLRAEQIAAVAAWRKRRRGVVVMPTGAGKTEVALEIIREAAVATLVVAPVRDLMYQWHRRILTGLGCDAGIIGDSCFRVAPVSVTTYDSACMHMDRLGNRFGLIVFDECHHLPGPMRGDAARMSAAPQRLGLTATPPHNSARHDELARLIGPVAYELSLAAVRGQTLADYQVVRMPVHLSPEEQFRYDRLSRQVRAYLLHLRREHPGATWRDVCQRSRIDPQAERAVRAFRARRAIEDGAGAKLRVLEDLFRLHADEPCLVFVGSNRTARDVSRRFLIPCLLSHCGKRERREILEGVAAGDYPALVANRVLDEGVDLPEAKVAIVLGGTASTRQARQRLGCILRKSGNRTATLYEVVCGETHEAVQSRRRRRHEAFARTRRTIAPMRSG